LIQRVDSTSGSADLTVTLTKVGLIGLLGAGGFEDLTTVGDLTVHAPLLSVLDSSRPGFPIVIHLGVR